MKSLDHWAQFVSDNSCGFAAEEIEKLRESSLFRDLYGDLAGRDLLQLLSRVHKEVLSFGANITVNVAPGPQKPYKKFIYSADRRQFLWIIIQKTDLRTSVCLDYAADAAELDLSKKWYNPKEEFKKSYVCLGRAGTSITSEDIDVIPEYVSIVRKAYEQREKGTLLRGKSGNNTAAQERDASHRIHADKRFEEASPEEFEILCCQKLKEMGWSAQTTPKSGDQGVDVRAEKNGVVIVLQCKKYSSDTIGNKAVQEVISGRGYYKADVAFVVANVSYSNAAKKLAQTWNTHLLHYSQLGDIDDILRSYLKNKAI